MRKKIVLTFNEDGTVIIDPLGFSGKSCEAATRPYEEVLGVRTATRKKAEYYRTETSETVTRGG